MLDTGMVRRIDELGRVVIPKEMRRTLRIREGDPLEIYTDRDQLIFKKYSPITQFSAFYQAVAEGLAEMSKKTCIVIDTDSVLYTTAKSKEVIGSKISNQLRECLNERKSLALSRKDGDIIVPIILGDEMVIENQIIVPVISAGDCFGALIIYDADNTRKFSYEDVKLAQLGSSVLSRQFD